MTTEVSACLAEMRKLIGVSWEAGDGKNLTIVSWLDFIAQRYPGMASYCKSAETLPYFQWCGLTVAYAMAKAGIEPVFVSGTDETKDFLWAFAWLNWGQPETVPSPGDVVVFNWGGGHQHVTLFAADNGDGYWKCLGGNQSNRVQLSNFPKSSVSGIRSPPAASVDLVAAIRGERVSATQEDGDAIAPSSDQKFQTCVGFVLNDEGGNVDDPRDPGGRTSRGITENDWLKWRQSHPGLPGDVFDAPQDQVKEIYREWYWNAISCDALPAGVDYAAFDYGVLSGVGTSARALQSLVGVTADGSIGPVTIAAVASADAATLVDQLCDSRLQAMRKTSIWPVFGKGWAARVDRVRTRAKAMVASSTNESLLEGASSGPDKTRRAPTGKSHRKVRHLGWLPQLPDYRDHLYSAPAAILQQLPEKVLLTPEFPIYDQGDIGSCTANALAAAVQFDRLKSGQSPDFTPSRLFIYYNERVIEGDVDVDGGAILRDGVRTLNQLGVCDEKDWPYLATAPATEGGPFPTGSKPVLKPAPECYRDALKYKITRYQSLTPTLSQLQGCLASGYPFVFGFTVYGSWYDQDPRPPLIPLPGADDSAVGGHAVLCVGYDNSTNLFKIRNSWGAEEGEKGYFYMPYAYLTGGRLASDFWVINAVED